MNFHSSSFVILSIFALSNHVQLIFSFECPKLQTIGESAIPDILNLVKNQAGYSAQVEVVGDNHQFVEIEDYYDGASESGRFMLNDAMTLARDTYYYYHTTKEVFIYTDGKCQSVRLDQVNQNTLISSWLKSDQLLAEKKLFTDYTHLGPVALVVYASQLGKNAQNVKAARIDGKLASHWFYCVNDDGPYMDIYFDPKTNVPVRLVIYYPSANDTSKITFSFQSFTPLVPSTNDPVTFPWGKGCIRRIEMKNVYPEWAKSDTYSLDMEAEVFWQYLGESVLSTARLVKFQGMTSYELSQGLERTRIVNEPKTGVDYKVNPKTGECSEFEASAHISDYNNVLKWLVSEDATFNLLNSDLFDVSGSNYMGQIDTFSGRFDIFEKIIPAFFYEDEYNIVDVAVIFFFKTQDSLEKRKQAPTKIEIVPNHMSRDAEGYASKIVITYADYREDNLEIGDRFDVSGCFDKPGEYLWFQVVFSAPPNVILAYKNRDSEIKENFENSVASLIPKIRLPDIRVQFLGANIYITARLLERPGFENFWSKMSDTTISNPSKVLIREHLSDCGAVCEQDADCKEFAFCGENFECLIYNLPSPGYSVRERVDGCSFYQLLNKNNLNTLSTDERNFLKNSKTLLHELKQKIEKSEIMLDNPIVSAEDLLIVHGPEVIGKFEDEYKDVDLFSDVALTKNFKLLQNDRRLVHGTKLNGISYPTCLQLCQGIGDCSTVSYCPLRESECFISSDSNNTVLDKSSDATVYSDGCNIFSHSYVSYFRKVPGKSLTVDAVEIIEKVDEESCAKACINSDNFKCESFDYCSNVEKSQVKSESVCFLHTFHIASDLAHSLDNVWSFKSASCNHYSKELSQDYNELFGRKFRNEDKKIISTVNDVSLENCASNCNSDGGKCNSYEFCEIVSKSKLKKITTQCRLSSYQSLNPKLTDFETTLDVCSVYVSKNLAPYEETREVKKGNLGLAIGLGSFFFILAFIGSVFGTYYYRIKRGG